MRTLFFHLVFNEGFSVGDAIKAIRFYGVMKNDPDYKIGENFYQNFATSIAQDVALEHPEFLDNLAEIKALSDLNNNRRIS